MNINKVNYQRTFNLGNYCSERIGVELDLNPGEDAIAALDTARRLVEEYHQKGNPDLYIYQTENVTPDIPVIPKKDTTKGWDKTDHEGIYSKDISGYDYAETKFTLSDQINSCKDLKTLESYKFIVKGKKELEEIYNNKLKELQ